MKPEAAVASELPTPFSFEVRETDLMGRVGVMRIGQKSFETPCLTPVIHPVWRDIPPSQFKAMGFDILMTNSYILYKRKRAEALEKGLHELIGFDGVLMTDSGGYQVLEYGDTEFTPEEIADFQSRMGSDLAVTLDKPTGLLQLQALRQGDDGGEPARGQGDDQTSLATRTRSG